MSRRVFLDLKEKELSVYLARENGKDGFSPDVLSVPVGEGWSFSLDRKNEEDAESCLSLPLSILNFRILELPFSDTKKIRELLPFEIDGLVLGGSGSVSFDALVLGKRNGNYRVLVVYLSKEVLRLIIERFKARGFDPSFVTCLELSHIIASQAPGGDVAELLIAPASLSDDERMNAAVTEIERPAINLRRDEFAYTVDTDKTRSSLKLTAVLVALLMTVFLCDTAMTIFSMNRENTALRDDLRKTYLGLFPGETKITSEIYQMRAHMKEMEEKKGSYIGVSPLQTLLSLSGFTRAGLSLGEITLEKEILVLKGECSTLSDVQKFRNALEGTFSDVVVSDTKPSASNRTLFTITARVKKT